MNNIDNILKVIIKETWNFLDNKEIKNPGRSPEKTNWLHFLGTLIILINLKIPKENIKNIKIEIGGNFDLEKILLKYKFLNEYSNIINLMTFKKTISMTDTNIINSKGINKKFNIDSIIELQNYYIKQIPILFKMPLQSINKNIFNYLNTLMSEPNRSFKSYRKVIIFDLYPNKTINNIYGKFKDEIVSNYFYNEEYFKYSEIMNNFISLKIKYFLNPQFFEYIKNNDFLILQEKDILIENTDILKTKLKLKQLNYSYSKIEFEKEKLFNVLKFHTDIQSNELKNIYKYINNLKYFKEI
jgi:hypothetical protein